MEDTIQRVPNTQPINFRSEDKPVRKNGAAYATEYRQQRDEAQTKLHEATVRIDELEKQLNDKYQSGYQAGITKGKEDSKHPALEATHEAWYKRATYAEYQEKKLRNLLAEVMKVITNGALE